MSSLPTYLAFITLTSSILFSSISSATSEFHKLELALSCLNDEFVQTRHEIRNKLICSSLCSANTRCQAFSMSEQGPCRLFVFDRCSKNLNDCSCTRRADVFVKKQLALPPGALCPTGFSHDLCGTKYKVYSGVWWGPVRDTIENEPGLVIMADAHDPIELNHLLSLKNDVYSWEMVMLGGHQLDGSEEPDGGWMWIGCNTSIRADLWGNGEPNNMPGSGGVTENTATLYGNVPNLFDAREHCPEAAGGLAECVSPFN